jgi:hypothetical protein
MRKTSVYLDDRQAEHLAVLAHEAGFQRIDKDARPIAEIPEHELLEGFGA